MTQYTVRVTVVVEADDADDAESLTFDALSAAFGVGCVIEVRERPLDPDEWWDSLGDDERDSVLASAVTGASEDYSFLDDEDSDA